MTTEEKIKELIKVYESRIVRLKNPRLFTDKELKVNETYAILWKSVVEDLKKLIKDKT